MDIVCAADTNYVEHCTVMLTSLFQKNRGESITVHLLSDGMSDAGIASIDKAVSSFGGTFRVYPIDPELLKKCPIKATDHLSLATYNRLLMAEILPREIDKLLYLDCDIVIRGSLRELFDTPLDGYALAAVEEMGCTRPDAYERLGFDPKYGYFNAGVLLVNLAYWRQIDSVNLFFDYIAANYDRIVAHDQDVLNALFHAKCLHLDCKWNVEEAFYHHCVLKRLGFNRKLRRALLHPVVLHYTWKPKPWDPDCRHPFRIAYYRCLERVRGGTMFRLRYLRAFADRWLAVPVLRLGLRSKRFHRLK